MASKQKKIDFLFNYQQYILPVFLVIILILPIFINFLQAKPFIMSRESYYHLAQSEDISWQNLYYYPLAVSKWLLTQNSLILIPLGLALASLFLFLKLMQKLKTEKKVTFLFAFFLMFSPIFIFTYSNLSSYSFYLFLLLGGFLLLMQEKEGLRYLSLIPFILAMFIEIYCSVLLLIILGTYIYTKKPTGLLPPLLLSLTTLSLIINATVFDLPFVLGPFRSESSLIHLFTDLGSQSGISSFIIFLALMGIIIAWKKKELRGAYLLLLIILPVYFYQKQTLFILNLITIFFASQGFEGLFQKKWVLDKLRTFTFLVVLLGIIFSTIAYFERIDLNGPSAEELKTLNWIRQNTPEKMMVFSTPENSYYLSYIANREPFYHPQLKKENKEESEKILAAVYITELFPLLEENGIQLIYVNTEMKKQLPDNYGFLYLLKNERFKLVHSTESTEVWFFTRE